MRPEWRASARVDCPRWERGIGGIPEDRPWWWRLRAWLCFHISIEMGAVIATRRQRAWRWLLFGRPKRDEIAQVLHVEREEVELKLRWIKSGGVNWQEVQSKLTEWANDPSALAEDDLIPPTQVALRVAIGITEAVALVGWIPPTRVVPDGDGGIDLVLRHGNSSDSIEIAANGAIEHVECDDNGRIVRRQGIEDADAWIADVRAWAASHPLEGAV